MTDPFLAIANQRTHLTKKKQELELQIAQVNEELQKLDEVSTTIHDLISEYLCPYCAGRGEIRIADAAGQMCSEACPKCKGTGVRSTEPED